MSGHKKISGLLFTVFTAAIMLLSGACGGGENNIVIGDDGKPVVTGKTKIQFWAAVSASNKSIYDGLVAKFNAENEYQIEVKLVPKTTGYDSALGTSLKSNSPPDVVQVSDKYIKSYATDGLLEPLDDYLNNDNFRAKDGNGNNILNIDDIWPDAVRRFRYDVENYKESDTAPLYGLIAYVDPTVLFYNATQMRGQGINIISIAENELDAYNASNGTHYLPHGYYEYNTAPASGLTQKDGKYRVFNNLICMNFEETVQIGKIFTKSYNASSPSDYGFFTEWWFSHGWSVGGDCIQWDDTLDGGQYRFTLGDQNPNYIITGAAGATVNGTSYAEGELLEYADKIYVANNKADAGVAELLTSRVLYEIPSQYDAFEEFCRLSQARDKEVNPGVAGYGISPNPNTINNDGKSMYFTSGKAAILSVEMSTIVAINNSVGTRFEYDVAPQTQYREYEPDGTLTTVNGTAIVGKLAGANNCGSLAIPQKSKAKFASWVFVEWMASEYAQSELAKTGSQLPNQISYTFSDAYQKAANPLPKNRRAVAEMGYYQTEGDWAYLENGAWVDPWANVLNGPVRNGTKSISDFFDEVTNSTNASLKQYRGKK
ncbi:MAG: extracellular solute-binding protein [Clostridiales bacterium]|jgi:maltose-binding protein MalE|nr:extracellular solute-binding protein [Clostridiales bacterium]